MHGIPSSKFLLPSYLNIRAYIMYWPNNFKKYFHDDVGRQGLEI